MSRIYRDYFNQTVLTIPDKFIDVKTGDTHIIPPKILEEIEYHSENNTLQHLIFSALNDYFHNAPIQKEGPADVLAELLEIKKILNLGNTNQTQVSAATKPTVSQKVDLKEIEDLLEAFGG